VVLQSCVNVHHDYLIKYLAVFLFFHTILYHVIPRYAIVETKLKEYVC